MLNIPAFFKRIGLPENTEITHTRELLDEIQYHQVLTVPYENLDILDGIPLSLEAEHLFDKIVTRGRGGYCFEVNGLLSAMLKEMGFDVKNYFARFLRGEASIPVRRHRILAVQAEGETWICDTGIGQSAPRLPLLLKEGIVQKQCGETYRFQKEPFLGWVLWDLHNGEWRKFYSFTEEEQLDIDFSHSSFFCEKHPDSPFNKTVIASIKTPDGRYTVNDREYKEFRGDEIIYCESNMDDARRCEILREKFYLNRD